jgi:asparagine synthase (glutamine-hydrolysing)
MGERLGALEPLMTRLRDGLLDLSYTVGSSKLKHLHRELSRITYDGVEQYQYVVEAPIEDDILKELLGEEYVDRIDDDSALSAYAESGSESFSVGDLQFIDFNTFLPDDILMKVDRASMANSLEVRVPLLDRQLVDYAFRLDDEINYKSGEKKNLLKQVARTLLPAEMIDRPKQGFGAPIQEMGFLDEYRSLLKRSHAAEAGVFDQAALDKLSRFPKATQFKLLMFEFWYRHWIEGIPTDELV